MRAFIFGIVVVFLLAGCSWSERDLDGDPDLDGVDGGDVDSPDGDGGAGDQVSDKGGDEVGGDDGGGGDEGPRQLRRAVLLGDGGFFGTSGIRVGTVNGHAGGSYVIAGHYADISTDPENPIQAGKVYFFNNGKIPESIGEATLVLAPPDGAVAGFGYSLSGPCDIDNDGFLDLPVGDHLYSPAGASYSGRVVVFWGDSSGTLSIERHSYHRLSDSMRRSSDSMGQSIVCADFNGDGYDDLLSTGQNAGLDDTGIGAIYYGSETGLLEFPDEIITPQILAERQYFGAATVYEDLDGDGDRDLAVGAWELIKGTQETDPHTGGVAVFLGGSDWTQGPDYNLFPPTDQVTHMGMDLAYADTGDRQFLVVGVPDYPAEFNGSVSVYEVGMADWQLQPPVVVLRPPGGAIHSGFPSDMAYIPDYYGRDQGALLIGMRYGDASPTVTGVGIVAAFPRTADGTSFGEFADILSAPDPVSNDSFGISIVPLDDVDGDGLRDFFIGMSQHLEGTPEEGTQTGGVVFFY